MERQDVNSTTHLSLADDICKILDTQINVSVRKDADGWAVVAQEESGSAVLEIFKDAPAAMAFMQKAKNVAKARKIAVYVIQRLC